MRAVGIVRVSQVAGRAGESFASPLEQRERIEGACERDGLELVAVHEELDVSGGTPLERRPGLLAAVEAVEAGEAEVVVAAYFDRLVRSLKVQEELVSRVEAAGGRVMAVDVGAVSAESASQWVVGTFLGAVAEYQRRATRERAGAAQARAVARGVPPWPLIPPGYERGPEGVLRPSADAPVVAEGFAMRSRGATVKEVRAFLVEHGVHRSYHGVQAMLGSRVYVGELHFGALHNPDAHEAIVSPEVFAAVQKVRVSRGRRAKSERLLARLGVLRCGSCGSRMVVGTTAKRYPIYRCPPTGDCTQRVAIAAHIAEDAVVEVVRRELRDVEGRASAESGAREAAAKAERAQADLDAALRAFGGLEDEPAARERLGELREARDMAAEEAHRLRGLHSALAVTGADWERLTLTERRALIRAAVERAEVRPGRGPNRVSVHLFRE